MPIVCLSWETANLYGDAWISHHRLRHRLFVERQGWTVPSYRGLEYDQFDTPAARYVLWLDRHGAARGAARLIPTTQPYMLKTLWPDLVEGDPPQSGVIWEASRFGCDRDLDPRQRRRVIAELICGCQEFGIDNGVSKYIGVMPLQIFKHVFMAVGCTVTIAGRPRQIGRHDVAAAYIDVSTQMLAAVRAMTGVAGPVLNHAQTREPILRPKPRWWRISRERIVSATKSLGGQNTAASDAASSPSARAP